MCHSCVSRNPGLFPRKREPRQRWSFYILDSHFRGNDNPKFPSPGLAFGQGGLSDSQGRDG